MKKIKKYIYLIAVILLSVLAIYIFMNFKKSSDTEISSTAVLNQIRNISELNTVEMYFDEIVDFKNAKKFKGWTIPFTKKSFIFTADARVKAGLNLRKLTEEDIKINKKKITIILPQPSITSEEILNTKTYDEKEGIFNEITNEDTLKAIDTFKAHLKKQATDSGILEKARENARITIEKWLTFMGFKEIHIQFK